MSIDNISTYYADLLLAQYRDQTRARATIRLLAKQALADMITDQVNAAFDIDTAVGTQLDIIGKYVGLSRMVGDPIAQPYFDFSDYDGTIRNNGFTDYTDAAINAQAIWYQYQFQGQRNTTLSDDAFMFLIKAQIILNANDGTLCSIQQLLLNFLPGAVALTDNHDMTMTYTLGSKLPVSNTVMQNWLPAPAGVSITFIYMTAAAAPSTLTRTVYSASGAVECESQPVCVATPTNGTGPYSYLWKYVSGDTHVYATYLPYSDSLHWYIYDLPGTTRSAVWKCTISDSRGIVAVSNNVTITLSVQLPP
jgi:hypothetical protein